MQTEGTFVARKHIPNTVLPLSLSTSLDLSTSRPLDLSLDLSLDLLTSLDLPLSLDLSRPPSLYLPPSRSPSALRCEKLSSELGRNHRGPHALPEHEVRVAVQI